jgi:hypothetical protein
VLEGGKENEDSGAPEAKEEQVKQGEPLDELRDEKKGEEANGTAREDATRGGDQRKADDANGTAKEEAAQAGDKRKADEKVEPEETAGTEDQEAKKQKTSDGTAATNGPKKEPGVSKGGEKKASGPKKEKKVPRTGTAERKTRSQGSAPDSGL